MSQPQRRSSHDLVRCTLIFAVLLITAPILASGKDWASTPYACDSNAPTALLSCAQEALLRGDLVHSAALSEQAAELFEKQKKLEGQLRALDLQIIAQIGSWNFDSAERSMEQRTFLLKGCQGCGYEDEGLSARLRDDLTRARETAKGLEQNLKEELSRATDLKIQAAITHAHLSLGRYYYQTDRLLDAEVHFRKGLAGAPANSPIVLEDKGRLARILEIRGDFDRAEELLRSRVRDSRSLEGDASAEIVQALGHLADFLGRRDRTDEALAVRKELREVATKTRLPSWVPAD